MLIGYARVSTDDQTLDLHRDALQAKACSRICVRSHRLWVGSGQGWPDEPAWWARHGARCTDGTPIGGILNLAAA